MGKSLLEQFDDNLSKASLIDSNTTASGTFIWLPDGLSMRNLFLDEVKRLFGQYDFEEYLFPEFVTIDDFNVIATSIKDFTKGVYILDKDRLLSPSGESIIYPYFRYKVHTHKDLPIKVFQVGRSFRKGTSRSVFRLNENGPFIEAHSAHSTRQEAENQVLANIECFRKILNFLGLPSAFSERPAWGNNPVAEQIFAFDTLLPNGETIHLNSVYSQMQTFSKPFGIEFSDGNGWKDFTYQVEFGFGCRMIFATLFLSMDEKGLNIPPQIAPKQAVITPIFSKTNFSEIYEYAVRIKGVLTQDGVRVIIDDDMDKSIGKRRNTSEINGVPIRIEIGNSEYENGKVTLVSRETREKSIVSSCSVVEKIKAMLDDSTSRMKTRLKLKHEQGLIRTESFDSMANIIRDGKIANFPLCHTQKCSTELERAVRGEVLGYRNNDNRECCIICGKPTFHLAFHARHI